MFRNKKLVVSALVVMALPIFAACGGDANPTATPLAVATPTTMMAADTPTTAMAADTPTTMMAADTPTTMMAAGTPTAMTAMTPTAGAGGTVNTGGNGGKDFSWRAYAEPETMDPALMQENLSIDLGQNLYDALVEFEPNTQKIQGALASSWDVSPDSAVYTFHLRKDVKFSNGDPFTSADVVYSYNRVANTKDAPYEFVMEDIKGFSDVRASLTSTDTTKPKVTTVSGIEAPDPYTVKITLKNPSAYFISEATVWTYFVVNQKVVESGGTDWVTKPGVGTGAYMLSSWKHNESMDMVPNPNYYGTPKPTVNVHVPILKDTDSAQLLFENGQLSVLDGPDANSLDRLQKDATLSKELHSVGQARSVWVGLNVMKAPFGPVGDPKADKLRQAFAMSIDRDKLVDLALSGSAQSLTTLLPQGEPGYNAADAAPYKFDSAAAKQLLADAGYPGCAGLDLTYTYRQRDAEQHVAEQLQAQWKDNLGCDIKIAGVEWKDMLGARQAHQYTMFYGSWGHDYPDPQDWLFALFHSSQIQGVGTGSGNDPGYSNKTFDDLVVQANQLADPAKVDQRMALYQQAETQLLKDAPLIPLYQATRYWEATTKFNGYNTNNSFIFPFKYVTPAQ